MAGYISGIVKLQVYWQQFEGNGNYKVYIPKPASHPKSPPQFTSISINCGMSASFVDGYLNGDVGYT